MMPELLTADRAEVLSRDVLDRVTVDGAHLALHSVLDANTRYAVNQITTSGESADLEAELTVRVGLRAASVTFNRFGSTDVADAVERAQTLARLAPEDPERMPLLGPQTYPAVQAYFPATAELDPARRTDAVQVVIEPAARAGLTATGFLQQRLQAWAVATTAGLFAYHSESLVSHTVTARTADGDASGWAGTTHNDWGRLTPPAELGARAVEKAQLSRDMRPVEPGAYTVLLEPTAVGNLVQLLGFSLGARAAEEGRSFFARPGGGTKVGDTVFDPRVTLASDPTNPDVLARPFTEEGVPTAPTVWVEDGVVRRLAYDRYWASERRVEPRPFAGFLALTGSEVTGDLLSGVRRGLLVTRFWYIRSTDPRTISYTGLTRDGTFLIENGRLTRPVKNLRFNQSVVQMLRQIDGMGRPERVVASESGGLGNPIVVPPLLVRDFQFTSISDAV